MSRRLTRKQIKRDEVRESLDSVLDFVMVHRMAILYGLLALVVAAVATVGVRSFLEQREVRAAEILARAMQVQEASIDPVAPRPDDPVAPSFSDEISREARAIELLEQIEREYPSTDSAAIASVYRAGLAAERGDVETARALWEEFVREQENHALASEVRLNLMELDRQQGREQELVAEIRSVLEGQESPLPEDLLLFELAKTLESLDDEEAVETYRRLLEEHPDSSFATEARNRRDRLAPSGLGG